MKAAVPLMVCAAAADGLLTLGVHLFGKGKKR